MELLAAVLVRGDRIATRDSGLARLSDNMQRRSRPYYRWPLVHLASRPLLKTPPILSLAIISMSAKKPTWPFPSLAENPSQSASWRFSGQQCCLTYPPRSERVYTRIHERLSKCGSRRQGGRSRASGRSRTSGREAQAPRRRAQGQPQCPQARTLRRRGAGCAHRPARPDPVGHSRLGWSASGQPGDRLRSLRDGGRGGGSPDSSGQKEQFHCAAGSPGGGGGGGSPISPGQKEQFHCGVRSGVRRIRNPAQARPRRSTRQRQCAEERQALRQAARLRCPVPPVLEIGPHHPRLCRGAAGREEGRGARRGQSPARSRPRSGPWPGPDGPRLSRGWWRRQARRAACCRRRSRTCPARPDRSRARCRRLRRHSPRAG
jgi:hypothetical protein